MSGPGIFLLICYSNPPTTMVLFKKISGNSVPWFLEFFRFTIIFGFFSTTLKDIAPPPLITPDSVSQNIRHLFSAAFLDAVNAASMGLMAAVTIKLASRILFPAGDWQTLNWQALIIALAACVVTLRWKVGAAWLVVGGAIMGVLFWLAGL